MWRAIVGLAIIAIFAALDVPAPAQPASDTAKYQPTILELRACIRANAPPAQIAGIRAMDEAIQFFRARCYQAFTDNLTRLGAADAAPGGFRLIVREEWSAFSDHVGNR